MNKFTSVIVLSSISLMAAIGCGSNQNPPLNLNKQIPNPPSNAPGASLHYPTALHDQTVDSYTSSKGAVKVADPFRWMEDPDSNGTKNWVASENAVTLPYLAKLKNQSSIKTRLEKLWNFERYSLPEKVAGKYYFLKNSGTQNQSVLYVSDSLTAKPRMILDPNPLSSDGTTAIAEFQVSKNGKYLAYGLQEKGTDWRRWKIRDLETEKDLNDEILFSKYGDPVAWTKDNLGFYYDRFPKPVSNVDLNENEMVYYHTVGTSQNADKLIYSRPQNKDWYLSPSVSEDGEYLIISAGGDSNNSIVIYQDLTDPKSKPTDLMPMTGSFYSYLGNEGKTFLLETNNKAPNYRVVSLNLNNPSESNWKEVIPQTDEPISLANVLDKNLVMGYLKDAYSVTKIYDLEGNFVRDVLFPEKYITADGFYTVSKDGETFYTYDSFITAGTIYSYNMMTGSSALFQKPALDFDSSRYETKQVFYKSKDGTKIPMFITAKKGLALNGKNPTLLYAYGGFNISITPSLSVTDLVWMERGGVFASANLRGGGEYGDKWHLAGTKLNKQNVFDDFIAAAEYLISEKYTSTPKLAIMGGSNGGLLIGAVLMQRPELFGAALPMVGVMDMLRFNKFSAGRFWTDDYGSPEPLPENPKVWDPKQFDALYSYSPYHAALRAQKKAIHFPPTLITTSDHDDRVVPMHSLKFAAALQEAQKGNAPILIRVETNAGHGSGLPLSKKIQVVADQLSFVEEAFGE